MNGNITVKYDKSNLKSTIISLKLYLLNFKIKANKTGTNIKILVNLKKSTSNLLILKEK